MERLSVSGQITQNIPGFIVLVVPAPPAAQVKGLLQQSRETDTSDERERPGICQFIKFGVVGASSTAVNFVCFNLLDHKIGVPLLSSLTISFLIATVNGFFWNRSWTFRGGRTKAIHTQSLQFLLVNLIGWLLNTSIVVVIVAHLTTKGMNMLGSADQYRHVVISVISSEGGRQYGFWQLNGALAVATLIVMFWNFFANRLWTFRH